jgi:hypothetical protein
VDTIARIRKRWLAVAAAVIGLSAPVAAQPGSDDLQMKPAAPPRGNAWPDFPPPPDATKIPTRPAELPLDNTGPKSPFATTSGYLPPFQGMGKGNAVPAAGSFPQPDAPLDPTPAPAKVWNVSSNPNAAPGTQSGDRTPRDFGNGWKGVVNQKLTGREAPAAALAKPVGTGGPRPAWNWHGYDTPNQGRPEVSELPPGANAAELDRYKKYAHLWRPAVWAGTYTQALTTPTNSAPLMMPLSTTANAEPTVKPTASMTPSVTVPLDAVGRPASPIQPTEYRAPLQPPPVPPTAPVPPRPKVVILPDAGGANGLPLGVRERVSQVCTGKCRNLAVTMPKPSRLTISFMVKDPMEAELLTNMLGALPELAAYKVDFEVQIGQ